MSAHGESISAAGTLRLVRPGEESVPDARISVYEKVARENRLSAEANLNPNDARWVLALRTAQSLQGAQLLPEKRESLLRLATHLGMRPFDANLVIAIVQDRARRGELEMTTGSGISADMVHDLAMISPPKTHPDRPWWARYTTGMILLISLSMFWAFLILRWLLS
ncbi:MAG TPA: hypothetical protein ENJ06_05550 [Phycisphaeraceae bacterium]|nr:hypothetical protein [Phycisphaeraceae bacterium]